jgi:hypothetical protein
MWTVNDNKIASLLRSNLYLDQVTRRLPEIAVRAHSTQCYGVGHIAAGLFIISCRQTEYKYEHKY